MSAWASEPGVVDEVPPGRATSSLRAMNRSAKTTRDGRRKLSPVLPCQQGQVWLELTMMDDDGQPVAQSDCTLRIPEGNGLTRRTDDQGYVRFDGISADPETFMLRFDALPDDNVQPGFAISVIPRTPGREQPAPDGDTMQDEHYFELHWERESLIWSE